ncbi:MAG TPA: transcription antitermination factor NusB [Candidatus Kapabacteria bacterium]|jgi:N utilization substance protein B
MTSPKDSSPKHSNHLPFEALEPPRIETDELFDNDPKRDSAMPRRRLARERVMQVLYAHDVSGGDLDALKWELIERDLARDYDDASKENSESNEQALQFARDLIREILNHREEINEMITQRLQRWDLRRVALIDRILIQMGSVELMYFPDIPPKATMNELIEIAKDFSTEESGKFINGILHAIMTHLNENGLMHKAGRGLMEESFSGYRPAKSKK